MDFLPVLFGLIGFVVGFVIRGWLAYRQERDKQLRDLFDLDFNHKSPGRSHRQ